MAISFVRGAIAGGAAVHLCQWTKAQSRQEATADTWIPLALQINHLLLLTAETLFFANFPLGILANCVRAATILAPIAVSISLYQKPVAPFSLETLGWFNDVYRVGVIVAAVASCLLGDPVFAAAALGMLATDLITNEKAKAVCAKVNKCMGVLAFIGYSAQIMASEAAYATMAKISVVIVGGKFFLDFLNEPKDRYRPAGPGHSHPPIVIVTRAYPSYPQSGSAINRNPPPPASSASSSLGNTLCRPSVW